MSKLSEDTAGLTSGTWLITFADLMTLLLCSFLLFFSMTWKKHQEAPQPLTPVADSPEGRENSRDNGTHLAAMPPKDAAPGPLKQDVRFQAFEVDYEEGLLGLKAEALARLVSQVNPAGYEVSRLLVRTCSVGPESHGWEVSASRAALLRRQLIDAGVRSSVIQVEALGTWCSGLGVLRGVPVVVSVEATVTRDDG